MCNLYLWGAMSATVDKQMFISIGGGANKRSMQDDNLGTIVYLKALLPLMK